MRVTLTEHCQYQPKAEKTCRNRPLGSQCQLDLVSGNTVNEAEGIHFIRNVSYFRNALNGSLRYC
jgi:hypothetical protein